MAQAVDPICGMTVDTETALSSTAAGETHYFCSAQCKTRFETEFGADARPSPAASPHPLPEGEATPPLSPLPPGEGGRRPGEGREARETPKWTCPMHPEIVRDKPGACPIC